MSGYYLSGVSCLPCSTSDCSTCASDTCTVCNSGFYLNGASCSVATVSDCLESKSGSAALCSTCNDGYYLGSDELCYECQANCVICTDRFTCTNCADNFHLMSGKCIVYPSNCLEIKTPVSGALECTLCEYGYYLTNGFCKECSVELGTLSKCDGLCPIDYYILSLLP